MEGCPAPLVRQVDPGPFGYEKLSNIWTPVSGHLVEQRRSCLVPVINICPSGDQPFYPVKRRYSIGILEGGNG